jgi:hypothetical protein
LLVVSLPDPDPLFKNCPHWRAQQKILWAEVRKGAGRGKDRFKIGDLFADERCNQAILNFLSATEVGRLAPSLAGGDARSEMSE